MKTFDNAIATIHAHPELFTFYNIKQIERTDLLIAELIDGQTDNNTAVELLEQLECDNILGKTQNAMIIHLVESIMFNNLFKSEFDHKITKLRKAATAHSPEAERVVNGALNRGEYHMTFKDFTEFDCINPAQYIYQEAEHLIYHYDLKI